MALRDVLFLVLVWMLVTQMTRASKLKSSAIFQTQSNSKPGLPGYHWAILRTNDLNKKYTGASMVTTLYNPQVSSDQYSASRVKVQNGEESIEAGWMVNQALFNDTRTHFYIYTKTKIVECFNNLCSGFVLVRQDSAPGVDYDKTTVPGGSLIMEETFSIEKDQANGNWYLLLGASQEIIGWWPKNIFSGGLADAANYIDWGGEVYSPSNEPSPAMGSGQKFLIRVSNVDAYCRKITFSNENYVIENAPVAGTETFIDTPRKFYNVYDEGVVETDYRLVYFGGRGQFTGE